jgi:hypothetical protein
MNIGTKKGFGAENGSVNVTLGRKVHDGVRPVLSQQAIDELAITDITSYEYVIRVSFYGGKVAQIPSIGQEIEVDHPTLSLRDPIQNEVRTDESGSAGNQNRTGCMRHS